jgi:uncharacterized protein
MEGSSLVAAELSRPARSYAPEWPATISVSELMESGWRPTPFRQFVLKIHSRCNLACDYCYVYRTADQSWRSQPRRMAWDTLRSTASQIVEHARAHRLREVRVILHGGEPLLAGHDYLKDAVQLLRREAGRTLRIDVGLQTNGILLDETFLRTFCTLDVQIGVSIDGGDDAQDRHRRHANGAGSSAGIAAGLRLLSSPEYRSVFSGLLCTIDTANEPIATYEALLAHGPPAVDFLLPHGNWSAPPPGRTPGDPRTPYADWLVKVFDRWYRAPVQETRVRLFEEIIHLTLGGTSATESVGLTPTSVVVVETDGSIEQTDILKSAYPGAPTTGLHVDHDPFDAALRLSSIAARQLGVDALSNECRHCQVGQICGGGLYPHRYRMGGGFRNPSVYCPDLYRLVTYIRDRVRTDVRALPIANA